MSDAGVQRGQNGSVRRLSTLVALALAAVALLAPADASAQIAPQPTGQDYCHYQSANGVFKAPNNGISYLNVSLAPGSSSGTVSVGMYGTGAGTAECINPQPSVCSSTCNFNVQAVCEYHCQHDHIAPYPWTVMVAPISGFLLGWNTSCVPRKEAPQSACIVQMPPPGSTTSATARFGLAPDPAAPTAPTASVSSVGSYAMTVSWSPASDENWLGGYDIYNGGTKLLRVGPGQTSARLESLSCQSTYNIRVAAFDTIHNTFSNTVSATTGACIGSSDTRRPNTIWHVKPPKVTRSRTASFHWGTSPPERARYRCKLDRRVWTKCRRSDPYRLSMGKTYYRLKPGYHTFRVRAIDRAGNRERYPAVYRWRIRR